MLRLTSAGSPTGGPPSDRNPDTGSGVIGFAPVENGCDQSDA
jgi:hypothetical protein